MLKIELKDHQRLFFTSDTHYNHKNICRGVTNWRRPDGTIPIEQTRDFETLDQMNSAIVDGINNTVGQDDILIHLGDWSFGGFEYIKEFRDRIICQNVHLILGNHDHHIQKNREEVRNLFSSVNQYTVLSVATQKDEFEFVLMHYPLTSWHDMNKGRMHLFGHVHLPPHQKVMDGRAMDVGMDGNNLKPCEIKEVLNILLPRPVKATSLPSDHHEERLKGEK